MKNYSLYSHIYIYIYIYIPSLIKVWKAVHNMYFVFNNMTCIAISRQDQTFIQQAKQTNEKKPPKNIISKIHHMDHEM